MALITISGFPSSGKSTRTTQIHDYIAQKIHQTDSSLKIHIISDDSLDISRDVYDQSSSEKTARSTLFTAIQRHLSPDTIVILDSLNYIKGFRYQLYCAAREMKLRTCTVFIVASPESCREWNTMRQDNHNYASTTLENLLVRFEEPSSMVRWDAPLFTVFWADQDIPGSEIWEAITRGNLKPPNSGTLAIAKAPGDALHILEQTTSAIVSAIVSETASHTSGGTITLRIGGLKQPITLPPRIITLSELQRLKRQFVTVHKKAITLGTTERGTVDWEEEIVSKKFSAYVEENLRP
ncbi:chromatin associated protein KTI12 [Crassisporium funariophilum]|nr:chromatin associated protein KTI12 [Crassisporium funariophilum]